jgi:hypothetical protein
MSSHTEEISIPAGSTVRVGRPADEPKEVIAALTEFFSHKPNVQWAGVGLMEVVYPDRKNEITYTIGIECTSDLETTIKEAGEILARTPGGRWPITIVPAQSQMFPQDVEPFFGVKPKRSWLYRLLYSDLTSWWKAS